eukprot:12857250-Heterocapsa_arctica.AAC.1
MQVQNVRISGSEFSTSLVETTLLLLLAGRPAGWLAGLPGSRVRVRVIGLGLGQILESIDKYRQVKTNI